MRAVIVKVCVMQVIMVWGRISVCLGRLIEGMFGERDAFIRNSSPCVSLKSLLGAVLPQPGFRRLLHLSPLDSRSPSYYLETGGHTSTLSSSFLLFRSARVHLHHPR